MTKLEHKGIRFYALLLPRKRSVRPQKSCLSPDAVPIPCVPLRAVIPTVYLRLVSCPDGWTVTSWQLRSGNGAAPWCWIWARGGAVLAVARSYSRPSPGGSTQHYRCSWDWDRIGGRGRNLPRFSKVARWPIVYVVHQIPIF